MRNKLWNDVIHEKLTASPTFEMDQLSMRILLTYLVMQQSQSAHCESALARRSAIRRALHGQGDTTTINRFAVVQCNQVGNVYDGKAQALCRAITNQLWPNMLFANHINKNNVTSGFRPRLRALRNAKGSKGVRRYTKRKLDKTSKFAGKLVEGSRLKLRRLKETGKQINDDDIMR